MWKAILCLCLLFPFSACAQVVTGYSFIENGDLYRAAQRAKQEAMRQLVENQLGVKVTSSSVVDKNVLVRDNIMTRADGYVLVKRIIKEGQQGQLYFMTLDLEVNEQKMAVAARDIPAQLEMLDDDSSRSGINVALVHLNGDTSFINNYFTGCLNNMGFRAEANDDVIAYLRAAGNNASDAEVRRRGRLGDRFASNAIIRGNVQIVRQPAFVGNGLYRAVVQVNCQLVGYDSNAVNTYAAYHDGLGQDSLEAVQRAMEAGLQACAQELGRQTVRTVQEENRGGVRNVKTTLVFTGQAAMYENHLRQALIDNQIRIVRSAVRPDGYYFFVHSQAYSNIEELKEALKAALPGLIREGMENQGMGSSKVMLQVGA